MVATVMGRAIVSKTGGRDIRTAMLHTCFVGLSRLEATCLLFPALLVLVPYPIAMPVTNPESHYIQLRPGDETAWIELMDTLLLNDFPF